MQDTRRLPYLRGRVPQQAAETPAQQLQSPTMVTQPPIAAQPQPQPQPPQPQPAQPQAESVTQRQQPINKEVPKKTSRIDTEQIPRPILRAEDTINYPMFRTSPIPLYHPPTSFSPFITEDDGNAGPRYIRSSVYAIGNESSITNQTELPMGVIVQPFADPGTYEESIPLVEFTGEPVRCQRCKAYINPFMQFIDSGSQFICNLCGFTNRTPNDYYAPVGAGNIRGDKYERFELCKGAYEIVAPKEYIKKPIENILVMFCIEFTHQSVNMGVYLQILSSIQSIIDSVQCPERTDIAIVTYDQRMNFYNIPSNLASEPQVIVVSDLDDVNIPLPIEKLFLNVVNDREKISYLIEKLQKLAETVQASKVHQGVPLGAMINNAANLLAPRSGRILVFTHQFPTIGLGKMSQRRLDQKIFGTDGEKAYYAPQDQTYVNIGKFCLQNHISIDLWVFNDNTHDLATIAPVSNITGGTIYYYPQYDPIVNGGELHYGLFRNLTRTYAYDSIMTLRLSNGLTLFDYCTGQGKVSVRDLDISSIDSDKSLAIYFKHEDKIATNEAYMQYAILYTNVYGQRLIRVFNLQLSVSNKTGGNNPWHNIFKTADIDAVLGLILRKHLGNITQFPCKIIRQSIFSDVVNILHAYRKYCSSTSPHGQLILPESIKTLPLLVQALYKRDALRQGQLRVDGRIFDIHLLMTASCNVVHNYLYPKMFPLHDLADTFVSNEYQLGVLLEENKVVMPQNVPDTIEKIRSDGIYILDTSTYLYIYVARGANESLLQEMFEVDNVDSLAQLEGIPNNPDSDMNQRLNNIIDQLRRNKNASYQPVKVVIQNSPNQLPFQSWLVEDEFRQEKAYGDFLCDVHAAIQTKGI